MKTLFILLFFSVWIGVVNANDYDSLYNVLKQEISKRNLYDAQKEGRIIELKRELGAAEPTDYLTQYSVCDALYEEYKNYIFDSAHVYAQKLHKLGLAMHDNGRRYESKIKMGNIQLSWGMFKEAFDCIKAIDPLSLSANHKLLYYELKAAAYQHLYYYNTDTFYVKDNKKEALTALDSVLKYADPGSYEKYRYSAERHVLTGHFADAVNDYEMLLKNVAGSNHQKAMAAHNLSTLTAGERASKLLMLSAVYDIRSSTKEALAILILAKQYYQKGNLAEAEFLFKEAKKQADYYGNKIRVQEINALLSMLSTKKLANSTNNENHTLTLLIITLAATIVGTLIIATLLFIKLKRVKIRERLVHENNKHLDMINKTLSQDGRIKEEYIGYFFNVVAGYINRLEKFKRTTELSVKNKTFTDLLSIAKEINIKHERDQMFEMFDRIFLKIFPNFLSSFNALFKEKDQIWPKERDALNTPLRIFALKRLGVEDTQAIADILENSISTIYTYKTRIKSKAVVPSDEFDRHVMNITFVDAL